MSRIDISNVVIACIVMTLGCNCATAADVPSKKIVLIAGPITGHGKNTHEYEKNVILLKHLLDTSPNVTGIKTEAHFNGWPRDESVLDDADSIVMITDGGDHKETNHPLYVGDRMKVLERQMKRGCGFLQFHWSTFNPSRFHDKITNWVGGYFDYETGKGARKWYSAIKTWEGPVSLGSPEHAISRGVKPFSLREEFYFNIRFNPTDNRVKRIVQTRPPAEDRDHTVGWAVERQDGGRGFGFTGGHFYANWWNDDYRKLILNAIVWTAGAEVPAGGVASKLEKPFKVLIVTGYNHPAHKWREVTAALILAIEQDPRAVVHVTEDLADLATDKIRDYDALVWNYSNWDRPGLSNAAKQNFMKYLEAGGGLSVIHFANGCFTDTIPNKESDWLEFRTKIVRRVWVHGEGKSGHDSFGDIRVDITAAGSKHPITAGLKSFPTTDELYFRQMGPLPIIPLAVAHSKVTDQDEPMAFAYNYGKGNIFQTVLGHADVSVRRAAALIRRGTVWAAGKKQISFDPPVELTEGALFRSGSPWTIEDSLKRAGLDKKQTSINPPANVNPIADGRFGSALDTRAGGAFVDGNAAFRKPPITVECWAKLNQKKTYNILIAHELKSSATHWEMFSMAGSGLFTVYTPGLTPDHVRSNTNICDGKWHHVAMIYEPQRMRLFVDGKVVADQEVKFNDGKTVPGDLAIGTLVSRNIGCDGLIDDVRISAGTHSIKSRPDKTLTVERDTVGLWHFDKIDDKNQFVDSAPAKAAALLASVKKK